MELNLPNRFSKPRSQGFTVIIDTGYSTQYFKDVITSHEDLIDFVKFGWGTCMVTKDIKQKIEFLNSVGINWFFGGTLFEKALQQNKVEEFRDFCQSHEAQFVEISNGTIDITNSQKAEYIKSFRSDFKVFSEVGYKDSDRSQNLSPSKWVSFIEEDFAAGATWVITESRESGKSGICRTNGEIRRGLIEDICAAVQTPENLVFEAPNKNLQTYFVARLGCNVNLANISFQDVVGLETLRLGLRSDTLLI